jgi:hypothetical protein
MSSSKIQKNQKEIKDENTQQSNNSEKALKENSADLDDKKENKLSAPIPQTWGAFFFYLSFGMIPVAGPALNAYRCYSKNDYAGTAINTVFVVADVYSLGTASKIKTFAETAFNSGKIMNDMIGKVSTKSYMNQAAHQTAVLAQAALKSKETWENLAKQLASYS